MTDKAKLLELAARCEAATGADRELDAAIAAECGRTVPFRVLQGGALSHQPEWVGGTSGNGHYLPFFTASIDAALTLSSTPRHIEWCVGHVEAICFGNCFDSAMYVGKAATPALALCAAALRARASQQTGEHEG